MKELGIEQLTDAYPSELSGGELRRVAIARALFQMCIRDRCFGKTFHTARVAGEKGLLRAADHAGRKPRVVHDLSLIHIYGKEKEYLLRAGVKILFSFVIYPAVENRRYLFCLLYTSERL